MALLIKFLILSATLPSVRQSVSLLLAILYEETDILLFKFPPDNGLCLGGKAGGLKLSVETKRPLGGRMGALFELLSELSSSIDKRLSVEADLEPAFFKRASKAFFSSSLAFSISLWNFSMPTPTLDA